MIATGRSGAGTAHGTDPATCHRVLARNGIGRVVFVHGGRIHIHPVNYGIDTDGSVFFLTGHGTTLRAADSKTAAVAFEVEEYDPAEGGVAVVVAGRMEPITDLATLYRVSHRGLRPWVLPGARPRWVRIRVAAVEGHAVPPAATNSEGDGP